MAYWLVAVTVNIAVLIVAVAFAVAFVAGWELMVWALN